jgi:hypothetical protein
MDRRHGIHTNLRLAIANPPKIVIGILRLFCEESKHWHPDPSQAQDDKPTDPVILSLFCEESKRCSPDLSPAQDDKPTDPVILSFFCEES